MKNASDGRRRITTIRIKGSDRWVNLQVPDPYGSSCDQNPDSRVGRPRVRVVFKEQRQLFSSAEIIPTALPAFLAFEEQVVAPIGEAIACHEDRIDGIHAAEASGWPFLVEGPISKGFFQLMDPGVLSLVSRKPCPKGVVHFAYLS